MAVNFPDSPSNGDTHTANGVVYTYNSTAEVWDTVSASSVDLSAIAQDILPDADSSRSLGSASKKWKDLHLSSSTIFLGDSSSISAGAGGEIVLPSLKIGTGSNAVKLEANSSGELETRAVVGGTTQAAKPAGGTTQVATLAAMQAIVNPSIGDLCSVTANNTIYMYNGTGFYKIAVMVNESPSAITGVDGAYALATDGTATTITAISSDPEGRSLSWSYSVTSGSLTNGGGATATVTQGTGSNSHIFTITPTTTETYSGSFSITFSVTDNVNGAVNAVSAFTLAFIVQNSRYTALSVKATNNPTYILSDTHSPASQHIPLGFVAMPSNQIFTIEGWFRIDNTSAQEIWFFDQHSDGVAGRSMLAVRAGYIAAYGTGGWINGSSAFSDTTTYKHLAWVQNGSDTLNFYVNGVASGTHTAFGQTAQQNTMFGENTAYGTGGFSCKGFRVTNTAVYTSAFTPPNIIGGLTDISGTQVLWDGSVGTATDASSNNRSLTNSGMTFTAVTGNQTFDDASTSNHTITTNGDVAASTFSPYRHDGYSASFDGTGDYLQTTLSENIGTSQFTIECWVRMPTTAGPSGVFHLSTSAFPGNLSGLAIFTRSSTYSYNWGFFNDGTQVNSSTAPSSGVWHHLALVRDSNNLITMYLDGNSLITATQTGSIAGDILTIGGYHSSSYIWNGDIRDFRIIKGTAVYASNFTPPTTPLTAITNTKFLLGQLPYFKDQSASNHAIAVNGDTSLKPKSVFDNAPYSEASHGASVYFDGTGDYLDVGSSGIANFGTGNFTIEFWINSTDANALGSGASNIINPISSTGSGYWGLMFQNGKLRWNNSYNVANLWEVNAATILKGSFNHVAVVRNSGAFSIYFNGVSQSAASGTFTDTTNYSGDTGVRIGSGNANNFVGTLSDLRIVSSAVYTTNFTPPTTPLTAITNTKFLLNPETSISDLSQSSAIQCFGDAATSTTQVKFAGTKSIAFDGTGDHLSILDNDIFNMSGNFTIEFWIWPSNSTLSSIFSTGHGSFESNSTVLTWNHNTVTDQFSLWVYNISSSAQILTSNTVSTSTWTHIAIVRSGNTITLYQNGSSVDTYTNSTTINFSHSGLKIGSYWNGTLNGYIQDFRIAKGLARYTANFTPPTEELEG